MRPILRWAKFMSSVVQVAPRSGQDINGRPTYGTPATYRAHIGRQTKLVLTSTGQQVTSTRTVWLNGSPAIIPTAQLTLSTSDVGSTEPALLHPIILSVARLSDGRGPHHTVLYTVLCVAAWLAGMWT